MKANLFYSILICNTDNLLHIIPSKIYLPDENCIVPQILKTSEDLKEKQSVLLLPYTDIHTQHEHILHTLIISWIVIRRSDLIVVHEHGYVKMNRQ